MKLAIGIADHATHFAIRTDFKFEIAIVTGFFGRFVDDPIPTKGHSAGDQRALSVAHHATHLAIRTGLGELITVITGLFTLGDAITTDHCDTLSGASVRVVIITIVTRLALLEDTIATARVLAGIGTAIIVYLIAIVTRFNPIEQKTVSADGDGACGGT